MPVLFFLFLIKMNRNSHFIIKIHELFLLNIVSVPSSASVNVFSADTPSTNQRLATPKPSQATPATQPIGGQTETRDTSTANDDTGTLKTTPKHKSDVSVQGG